jgi:hypothetical protein
MTTFDQIQQLWNNQVDTSIQLPAQELIVKAENNSKAIKLKHQHTIAILLGTLFLLFLYFIVYGNFTFSRFSAGLGLMILSIFTRTFIEYLSFRKFQQIDIKNSFTSYTANVTQFYSKRKKIHSIFTPIILLAYGLGFIVLLPVFKEELSTTMYLYVVISGSLFLLIFPFFIAKQNKKEMKLLSYLKNINLTI